MNKKDPIEISSFQPSTEFKLFGSMSAFFVDFQNWFIAQRTKNANISRSRERIGQVKNEVIFYLGPK